jgi:hypothetical protein
LSTSQQSPTATVLSVGVNEDIATTEIEISQEDYLRYPIAPAWLWCEETRQMIFPFDQLVGLNNRRLRLETYRPQSTLPRVGDVRQFVSLWNHWAMDAVQDVSAGWARQKYPYPGEHDHCLLTWETIAECAEHKEGYVSAHGWITVEAYEEYIERDRCRIRSNWQSIEKRPTDLHRITDTA